jgi:DNA helicase-2/ATP-dependent DNA helicase PcrA
MAEGLLSGLNERQRLVATSFDAPVCVMAGAGTGKTRAITHRIAYAVNTGRYDAENVLALTFTQKAAQEMAGRVRALGVDQVEARTFHSAALRQLQYFWPQLTDGYLPDIIASKAGVVSHVLEGMRMSVDQAVLRDISGEIEWRKVKAYTLEDYQQVVSTEGRPLPAGIDASTMVQIMQRYEQVKDERRRIDFEDVLLAAAGMLESEPAIASRIRARYRHFVVDEYQDVSPIQQRLLDVWLGESDDICVVGDASQTIYSFAGATSDYLVHFDEAFPNARVIQLEQNYRSTPDIIQAANLTVHGMPGALALQPQESETMPIVAGHLDTDEDEAAWVAEHIRALIAAGTAASDIAVLHRFSAQTLLTEGALKSAGVSVRVQGGTRFFDQPHVKRAVMEIRGAAVAGAGGSLLRAVDDVLYGLGYTERAPDHQGATRTTWEDLRAIRELAELAPEGQTLRAFSEELVKRAEAHDEPDLESVTLATVHSAKGQEWPVVFVVGMSTGQFPISYAETEEEIAEERRLFYVAITRARKKLALSWAKRHKAGVKASRQLSPFMAAIGITEV